MEGDTASEADVEHGNAKLLEGISRLEMERALRLDLCEDDVRRNLVDPAEPDGVAHGAQVHDRRPAGDEDEVRGFDGGGRVRFDLGGGVDKDKVDPWPSDTLSKSVKPAGWRPRYGQLLMIGCRQHEDPKGESSSC